MMCDVTESHGLIQGRGTVLAIVRVDNEGYGFPQKGLWAVMRWENLKDRDGKVMQGFNFDDGSPYANSPIFLGE